MSSIAKHLQGIISYRPSDQGGTSSLRCSNLHKSEYNLNHLSFSKSLKQRRARCSASPRTGETRRQEDQSGCQDASLKQRLCMPYLSCAWYTPWFGKSCKIELGRFTYVRKRHHLASSYTQLPDKSMLTLSWRHLPDIWKSVVVALNCRAGQSKQRWGGIWSCGWFQHAESPDSLLDLFLQPFGKKLKDKVNLSSVFHMTLCAWWLLGFRNPSNRAYPCDESPGAKDRQFSGSPGFVPWIQYWNGCIRTESKHKYMIYNIILIYCNDICTYYIYIH